MVRGRGESNGFRKLSKEFRWREKAGIREKKKGRAKRGIAIGLRKRVKYSAIGKWGYRLFIQKLHMY